MPKYNPHSEHNYKLCEHLLKQGDFYDWVITTAFYSALHLCQETIFPFTDENNKQHYNFDSYCNFLKNAKGKHNLLIEIVSNELPKVSNIYRHLHSICMTSRYQRYIVSLEKAQNAKNNLDILREIIKNDYSD